MGTTPVYGLRFPEGADTPDVPRDIENLALDVEAVVAAAPSTKVEHPNVADVVTYAWDAGMNRWQTEHYDSGWREVSGLLTNGFTATHARMRRVGNRVTFRLGALTAPGAASNFFTPPAGFRSTQYYTLAMCYLSSGEAGVYASNSNYLQVTLAGGTAIPAAVTAWTELSWTTDDTIPTSLPGTLVSPAPN